MLKTLNMFIKNILFWPQVDKDVWWMQVQIIFA